MSEKASLNCWICAGWKSENTPEGSRRMRDFWDFDSWDGVDWGVMFGDRKCDMNVEKYKADDWSVYNGGGTRS
jgi:hypothetical protein